MNSLYYSNGAPTHCMHCGNTFSEVDGHVVLVHVKGLGYFCSAEHAEEAKAIAWGQTEQLARLQ